MAKIMKIPGIHKDMSSLWSPFRKRLELLIANMEKRGFKCKVIETIRTHERQVYLYSLGRTVVGKIVTWTMKSLHLVGKAADIIPADGDWKDTAFFEALEEEAQNVGLETLAKIHDYAHVQWTGKPIPKKKAV